MDDSDLQPIDDAESDDMAGDDVASDAPQDVDEADTELEDDAEARERPDGESDEDDLDEPGDDLDDEATEDDDVEAEHATVASAGTVETARRLALDRLRKIVPVVNEADVEFIVLEEGARGGFFGRGKIEAQVEARLRPSGTAPSFPDEGPPPGAETLRAFVQGVVDRMGIEASVEAFDTPEAVRAEISGDDLGILIGRHGTTIDALQYIAAIAVNGDRRRRRQVVVDAEGYRTRREVSLKALADRSAQKVARDSSSMQLKPMTAAERKVIHLHLKDHPRVETVSEGQEPFRAVVISPKSRRG